MIDQTHLCGVPENRPADERDEHGCGQPCEPHWPTRDGLDGLVPICSTCCEENDLCEETGDPYAADDIGPLYVVTARLLSGAPSERLVHAASLLDARRSLNLRAVSVRRARRSDVQRIEAA